jgi:hypothetical protein
MKEKTEQLIDYLQRQPHQRLIQVILALPMPSRIVSRVEGFRDAVQAVKDYQEMNTSMNQKGRQGYLEDRFSGLSDTSKQFWRTMGSEIITADTNIKTREAQDAIDSIGAMQFLAAYVEDAISNGRENEVLASITQALQFSG